MIQNIFKVCFYKSKQTLLLLRRKDELVLIDENKGFY